MAEYKKCTRCKTNKPLSDFRRDKNRKDGLYPYCKECCKVFENIEASRSRARKRFYKMYGIDETNYQLLYKKQNGRCMICNKHQQGKRLAVDHNHINGTVRGLLCSTCNSGLGHFKDNVGLLRAAIVYLEAF